MYDAIRLCTNLKTILSSNYIRFFLTSTLDCLINFKLLQYSSKFDTSLSKPRLCNNYTTASRENHWAIPRAQPEGEVWFSTINLW